MFRYAVDSGGDSLIQGTYISFVASFYQVSAQVSKKNQGVYIYLVLFVKDKMKSLKLWGRHTLHVKFKKLPLPLI